MVITNEIILPTEEELTVPEVNLSSAALRAGAFHLGKQCEKQNLVSSTFHGRLLPNRICCRWALSLLIIRLPISFRFAYAETVVM